MAWAARLQSVYIGFEEFQHYSEIYGLARRLGYATAEEAWDDDPLVYGSSDPGEYHKVRSRLKWIFKEIAPDYNPEHDAWGYAMGAFFTVAELMHFERGLACPPEWRFRPGAALDTSCHEYEVLHDYLDLSDDELLRLGQFLHRLTGRIDRAGLSY